MVYCRCIAAGALALLAAAVAAGAAAPVRPAVPVPVRPGAPMPVRPAAPMPVRPGAAAPAAKAEGLPLGHKDFYPSPERPVGWRGDGSGAWPGATPVASWDAAAGKNVVWKTAMPGPSFSQPIVVGDKVFTPADPNWLLCLAARDGRILWQREVDHTSAMPKDLAAKARAARAFWDARFREYSLWLDLQQNPGPTGISKDEIARVQKAAEENAFDINHPGQANFEMIQKGGPLMKRSLEDQAAYSLYYFHHWEGIMTHTFPTPVSDGKYVFVNMSNDQVACYTLDGDCRWLLWDRPKTAKPGPHHTRYAMSPLLVGDKLIVAACGELRAYDKGTGRRLWGVSHPKDFGGGWSKVGSPVPMRLSLGGKPFEVLLSPGSGIYRVSDGARVGDLPEVRGYEGSTALSLGDVYVRKGAPDGGERPRLACRIRAEGPDRVVCEALWQQENTKTGNTTDVLWDGWIWSPQNGLRVDLASGKEGPIALARCSYSSPVLGGRLLVAIGGAGYGPKHKQEGVAAAAVLSVDSPAQAAAIPGAFVDRRYMEDQEFRLRWRWRGNGSAMSNSSPMFQANRMFYRTVGYLWCIGDPSDPWPTPKDCPAEARAPASGVRS